MPTPSTRSPSVRVDCSERSYANFPGAFTDPRNLIVGPLVLVGAAAEPMPASLVLEYGGNKFPVLVKTGRAVTVQISGEAQESAGLFYGQGGVLSRTRHSDTARRITFVACRRGKRSGSSADGVPVTFWSGFLVSRFPACVPLDVYVDRHPEPRRVAVPLGQRCSR